MIATKRPDLQKHHRDNSSTFIVKTKSRCRLLAADPLLSPAKFTDPVEIKQRSHVGGTFKINIAKKTWFWALLLLVFVGVIYFPALQGDFVFDDRNLIVDRALLLSMPNAYTVLPVNVYWWGTPYSPDAWRYYRPWVSLTYWFEYQLGGLKPFVYHLSNAMVHLSSTILIFVLMRSVVGMGAAFGIAALAAVCPTALTSVGWISGRTDLWATFFVLLFLLAFRAARKTRNIWPHIAASAAFLGGLASKEVAIVAPVIAWALDRCAPEQHSTEESRRRPLWHYLLLIIPLGIYFGLRRVATGKILPPSVSVLNFLEYLPGLAEQYLRTMFSMVLPLHYNFFTSLTWSPIDHRSGAFILGSLVFLAWIVLVVIGLRRRKLWAVGGLWIGIVLFPAYGLNRSPVTDFYAYLALPGFWLMIVDGLRTLILCISHREKLAAQWLGVAIVLAVIIFAGLTRHRLPLLASDVALWTHMTRREPLSESVATNLSKAYHRIGDSEQAFRWSLKAVALDSMAWMPHHNLAVYYLDRGDVRSAAPHVDALAELAPNHFDSQVAIARFYYTANHCSAAVETYQRAFMLGPPNADALFGFGNALLCVQKHQDAISAYQMALQFRPGWGAVYSNLGLCYENLGELDKAIAAQKEAIRLDSELILSRESLAILYVMKGDSVEARRAAQNFVAHNPPPERIQRLKNMMAQAKMDTNFISKENNQE